MDAISAFASMCIGSVLLAMLLIAFMANVQHLVSYVLDLDDE